MEAILILDLESNDNASGGKFVSVEKWMKSIPPGRWKLIKVRVGHKGWLSVRLATCRIRAMIENEIGDEETSIVSKWREDSGKPRCDYYLSHSKKRTDLDEYARVIKAAYRIEEAFHRGKGECGLADDQVRNWRGWHHHVALSMLSQWFLTEELMSQKSRTDDDDPACTGMLRWRVDRRAAEGLFPGGIRLFSKHAMA